MSAAVQSGPSALFLVALGGLALFSLALAFLFQRSGVAMPRQERVFRWSSRLVLVSGALLFTVFLLELVARIMLPGGYLQRRPDRGSEPEAVVERLPDGRAFWEYRGAREFGDDGLREVPTQDAGAWRLGVLGDSVTYGVNTPAPDRFIARLAAALTERCGPVQLIDAATPAYSLHEERVSFERKVLPAGPDVVFVGVFANDAAQFTVIGSTAYDIRVTGNGDFPLFSFLPLPDALNAALLEHSVFYQWMTLRGLSVADTLSGRSDEMMNLAVVELARIHEGCLGAGCTVVVALFPVLDGPLSEPENRDTGRFYESIRAWAGKQGVALIDVRPLLADEDVEAIRLDECCHYNQSGHAAVARVLTQEFLRLKLVPEGCL